MREQSGTGNNGGRIAGGQPAPVPLTLHSIKSLSKAIDPEFLRLLAHTAGIGTFVETGTFYGETAHAAAAIFTDVHTIELSDELHRHALERFAGQPHVHAHRGESADVLARILPGLRQPVLFWLDAHYSEANTARGRDNTPIVAELDAIHAAGIRDALILIDDLRCFQPAQAGTRESLHGYPTVAQLRDLIRALDPDASFVVLGDVAIAAIGSLRLAASALLQDCTLSRCHDDAGDAAPVVTAEQRIGACAEPERTALRALADDYQASERFGLGGHYRLWRGLLRLQEGDYAGARDDFAAALTLGCDHAHVRAYLARAEHAAKGSATPMDSTGEDRVIAHCLRPGAVVFDIGANVGDWTRAAVAQHPNLDVHLFEASPVTFQQLRTRVNAPASRCVFNQMALGNQRGYKTFHHYIDAPAWSTFYRRVEAERLYGKQAPVAMKVPVETLDGYAALHALNHIDFLKIDVEGAEYDVLSGATELLRAGAVDYIQFEYGGTYSDAGITLRMVYTLLRRFGYAVFRITAEGFEGVPAFDPALEDYAYSNFLAVHERLVTLFTGAKPRMLDLPTLFAQHGVNARGVIHIGAHEGREAQSYADMGFERMLFIEANPAVFSTLENNLRARPNARALNVAISDRDGTATLHVTSMDQSSSLLPLGQHRDIYPTIVETAAIEVPTRRLDALLAEQAIDPSAYNVLNIDIQGAELLALRGAEHTLRHIDAINTEINYAELYRGGTLIDALDAFLDAQGFTRVATVTPFHPSWGDALYVRKPLLSMSTLGSNGRFANQIFQYAFLKIQAGLHGSRVATPPWIGNTLFGAQDEPLPTDGALPELRQTLDQDLTRCAIANAEQPLRNVDLWGYFQYHTRYYAPHKAEFRELFRPVDPIRRQLHTALTRLGAGRTLVALHLRRGDYGYRIFYRTPCEWYRRWLAEIWPTLDNPMLYIASDEPDTVVSEFAEYRPLTARDVGVEIPEAPFYPDFYVLSQADHVAISNSSFSFAACMLNERAQTFMRPDLKAGCLIPFDPWSSEPLQRDALAEDYGAPFCVEDKTGTSSASPSVERPAATDGRRMNRVSVYITSYNQKAWLREAIDSVLAQTHPPYEIVIVDDASSDGSQTLIEDYRLRHPDLIRPIYHASNLGVARSRIDALTAVRGDYVTYVDGDDRLLPDKLERELATLAAHPEAEAVFSNFHFIDADGERTQVWAENDDIVYSGWIFPYVFARDFPKRTLFRNELVATEALRRIGFHDPALNVFEDFELRVRLSFAVRMVYCDHPLAEYRRHGGSLSHANLSGQLAALDYVYTKHAGLLSVLTAENRVRVARAFQDWVTQTFLPPIEHALEREPRIAGRVTVAVDADQDPSPIVLLALPWSGARLLQQVLERHPHVHGVGESNLLLPAVAFWNARTDARTPGLTNFLATLPTGDALYREHARRFVAALYSAACTQPEEATCLDCTPAYLEHIAVLREMLPRARFVLLLRDPGACAEAALAAAAIPMTESTPGHRERLTETLRQRCVEMAHALDVLGIDAVVVRYEELAEQPQSALRRLCARLALRAMPEMLAQVNTFAQIDPLDSAATRPAWTVRLAARGETANVVALLETLGAATVERLGYPFAETLEQLANPPSPSPDVPFEGEPDAVERARAAVTDGERHFAEGDFVAAEQAFRAALEWDADNADAYNNLGVLCWERGAGAEALNHLVQGLDRAPDYRPLVTNAVAILQAMQHDAEAAVLCDGYLSRHPDDVELRALADHLSSARHDYGVRIG